MLLDHTDFPIVRIDYDASGSGGLTASLAAFEALLGHRHSFVLIGRGASGQEQDHEERRQIALWMKRNREALGQYVLALVYVEPQAAHRITARAGAEMYRKFWGYPMLVTSSDDEARAMAARLLAGEPVGDVAMSSQHGAMDQ